MLQYSRTSLSSSKFLNDFAHIAFREENFAIKHLYFELNLTSRKSKIRINYIILFHNSSLLEILISNIRFETKHTFGYYTITLRQLL